MMDGTYHARLFDVSRFKTDDGRDAVSFVWDLFEVHERCSNALSLIDSKGQSNLYGIQLTQCWAKGWDGKDLDWFKANLAACQQTVLRIRIVDNQVNWYSPALSTSTTPTPTPSPSSTKRTLIKLVVDRDKRLEVPDGTAPSYVLAKAVFDSLTEGTEREDANKVWTLMAAKIGPMQIDFTPEDWGKMIDLMAKLKTARFEI